MSEKRILSVLKVGESGRIKKIESGDSDFKRRLMQLGFLEGNEVRVMLKAPIWKDPIAVNVRGTTIALRKTEASTIVLES